MYLCLLKQGRSNGIVEAQGQDEEAPLPYHTHTCTLMDLHAVMQHILRSFETSWPLNSVPPWLYIFEILCWL